MIPNDMTDIAHDVRMASRSRLTANATKGYWPFQSEQLIDTAAHTIRQRRRHHHHLSRFRLYS